ncbi:MAG: ATP-binding protein [Desulfomonilia bacterium]|jgi:PAS domain S-box-containing protein
MARRKPTEQGQRSRITRRLDALKKSEKHFRDLVEHSLTGISIIQDGRVVYRNPEQQRILGSLPDGSPPNLYDRIHPDDAPAVRRLHAELLAGRIDHPGMVARLFTGNPPGEESCMRWIHGRASLIEHEGRQAILLNMMDITAARELERMLTMQDRMTSLGHVAAGIAHEIRNPLSGITIYLNSLKKILSSGAGIEECSAVIDRMLDISQRIDAVIRRVMDFCRPGETKLAPIDIRIPVRDALSLSASTLRKAGIAVQTEIPDELPSCLADAQLIEQVMLNLITNAVEALKGSSGEKRLSLKLSSQADGIRILVGDSGPGVDPEKRRRIFDPFFTTKTGSTGIGLSLCHRIVTDHGGRLSVGTSPLGGAEFAVWLPAGKGPVQA